MSDASIKVIPNGPYIVSGVTEMKGPDGTLEASDGMALCRCGRTANAPFCDGTHNRCGVRDEVNAEASGKDTVISYEGEEITVLYNPRICSHAAVCVGGLRDVFDPSRKPWIDPDKGPAARIKAVVRGCPSGALRVDEGSGPEHMVLDRAAIEVEAKGPLRVTGPKLADGPETPGEGGTSEKYVLCRCGLSGNKPYCDGSHYNLKWSGGDRD